MTRGRVVFARGESLGLGRAGPDTREAAEPQDGREGNHRHFLVESHLDSSFSLLSRGARGEYRSTRFSSRWLLFPSPRIKYWHPARCDGDSGRGRGTIIREARWFGMRRGADPLPEHVLFKWANSVIFRGASRTSCGLRARREECPAQDGEDRCLPGFLVKAGDREELGEEAGMEARTRKGSASIVRSSASRPSGLRVALVHDWLTGMRGGRSAWRSSVRRSPTRPCTP